MYALWILSCRNPTRRAVATFDSYTLKEHLRWTSQLVQTSCPAKTRRTISLPWWDLISQQLVPSEIGGAHGTKPGRCNPSLAALPSACAQPWQQLNAGVRHAVFSMSFTAIEKDALFLGMPVEVLQCIHLVLARRAKEPVE